MLPTEKITFPRGLYLRLMKPQNILKLQLLEGKKKNSPKFLGICLNWVCLFFVLKSRNQCESCWIKIYIPIFSIWRINWKVQSCVYCSMLHFSKSKTSSPLLISKLRLSIEYLNILHSWQKSLYCSNRAFIMIIKCFCFLSRTFEMFVINSYYVVLMWSLVFLFLFFFLLEIIFFCLSSLSLVLILHRPVRIQPLYILVFMLTLEIS